MCGPRRELARTGRPIPQRDDHRHDGAAGEDRRETDHRVLHGEVPQGDAEQDGRQAHAQVGDDFLSLPERKPAGIDARELATVPLVLVVNAAHPLAQRGELTLADLAEEPFVDFPPGYGNREVVDRAFAAAGVVRRVALEVPDIDMGAALVRHGLGIAFLPAFAVARTPGLHVLDVHGTVLRWSMHLGTSSTRRPSSALRALLDLVDLHVLAL
ncbi:LysR substrate-binding domain-containing protein [Streptomyces nigra]|uniref:LysR substrate-binding domain-containing protein n=1 Tax=Streptomyces nigra TaxID=1827580 RepID=UPI0036C6FB0E